MLFFDCTYGISGDMTLGALLDLGVDLEELRRELKKVSFGGYSLSCTRINRHGTEAVKAAVAVDFGNPESEAEKNPSYIEKIIRESGLAPEVKRKSLQMFRILAGAQAQAHGIPLHEVHFHEKGAVDSLVDVIGTAVGLHLLGVEKIFSTPLGDGMGFIQCRCGRLPVPVPSTRVITQRFQIPVRKQPIESELVTPTGAAIAAANFSFRDQPPAEYSFVKTGCGAGDYEYGQGGYLKCSLYSVK